MRKKGKLSRNISIPDIEIGSKILISSYNPIIKMKSPIIVIDVKDINCLFTKFRLYKIKSRDGVEEWVNALYCHKIDGNHNQQSLMEQGVKNGNSKTNSTDS